MTLKRRQCNKPIMPSQSAICEHCRAF